MVPSNYCNTYFMPFINFFSLYVYKQFILLKLQILLLSSIISTIPLNMQTTINKFLVYTFKVLNNVYFQEFSYSLSVFISEIPLSNMTFDFAKNVMQNKRDDIVTGLRFNDKDVWAILNFLGMLYKVLLGHIMYTNHIC